MAIPVHPLLPLLGIPPEIRVVQCDITLLAVDAVVNAANASLLGGGGVDGAIHRAGGPDILRACQEIRRTRWPEGLPTGEVVITPGGRLPARFVIHTVGPIHHRDPQPAELLTACYRNALQMAKERQLASIAFPAISTGAFGYPKPEAARVAAVAIRQFLGGDPGTLRLVILAVFSRDDEEIWLSALQEGASGGPFSP
ncbi:MAG: O-acetyl-ADP-ribose deacetylase [Magnetococcales bacterium]|nr:O-acetyl-ADP-ribose deacetylase [Magnetococcales bacterium]